MKVNTKIENPFDIVTPNGKAITTQVDLEPLDWSQFAKQAGLRGTPITAEELVNKTFDILRAKKQDSSFEGQDHFWFCIVRPVGQDELFEVVLGGGAVIEILDAYAESGIQNPMRVTLDFKTGGKFKGYYTFK
jgi:hypothetical protein